VINGLTGAWAISTFGFISAVLAPIPWILYLFGARLRSQSRYNPPMLGAMMKSVTSRDEEMQMQEANMRGMDAAV